MTGPARAFFALIGALGGDVTIVPEPLRRRPATAEFDRALSDFLNFRSTIDEGWPRLRREALLATQPSVLLSRMATRLKGLVRPNSGLPD